MTNLGVALLSYRERRGYGLRALADDIGVSIGTVHRLGSAGTMDLVTFRKVLDWLCREAS